MNEALRIFTKLTSDDMKNHMGFDFRKIDTEKRYPVASIINSGWIENLWDVYIDIGEETENLLAVQRFESDNFTDENGKVLTKDEVNERLTAMFESQKLKKARVNE